MYFHMAKRDDEYCVLGIGQPSWRAYERSVVVGIGSMAMMTVITQHPKNVSKGTQVDGDGDHIFYNRNKTLK